MANRAPSRFPAARRSPSAEASRELELRRLRRLSVEQRILAALSLRRRLGAFRPAPLSR